MRLDKAGRKSLGGFVHVFLWAGSVVILNSVFAAVKAPENVCYTKEKTKRKCFLFSYPGIAYVIVNCSSSIWKDGMQSSFLRRYLMQNPVAASNWHDKRVTARGWHSSHPSCHWKHNALQCACSSGAAVRSQSLGCVTEQLHVVCFCLWCLLSGTRMGSGTECSGLFFFSRVQHEVDEDSEVLVECPLAWEDEQQGV